MNYKGGHRAARAAKNGKKKTDYFNYTQSKSWQIRTLYVHKWKAVGLKKRGLEITTFCENNFFFLFGT